MLGGIAAGSQVFGGIQAEKEGRRQGRLAEETAREQAEIRAEEVQEQIGRNVTLFAKSGVLLQGSPLLAIQEDIETGRRDVQSILSQGTQEAKSLRASGRAQLFSSLGGATSTVAGIV